MTHKTSQIRRFTYLLPAATTENVDVLTNTNSNPYFCKKIIGIDLGTTNSVVAIMESGTAIIIVNELGQRTTPSIITFRSTNKKPSGVTSKMILEEQIVGTFAKKQTILNPGNTFYFVKRFIGTKFADIQNEMKYVTYKIESDEEGNTRIKCPLFPEIFFSPEQMSAFIIKKLVTDAIRYLGKKIKDIVITVPAYFNDSQRTATKTAGTLAFCEVIRILNEPTAASLAYGINKKKSETVLVYDLGGGTFDVSILEVGANIFETLATAGDPHLGGNDFDQILIDYFYKIFKIKTSFDLKKERGNNFYIYDFNGIKLTLARMREFAELAKKELSLVFHTTIHLNYMCPNPNFFFNTMDLDNKNNPALSLEITITRAQFEVLTRDLLERCKQPIYKVLQDAKLKKYDIGEIILVGGSTRIPAVRNLLIHFFEKPLNESVNPDEVVALGAAIQGGIIAGEVIDLILLELTPISLGIETFGGLMTTMISCNTSIPVKQQNLFTTSLKNQEIVSIHVLQGEHYLAKKNKSLGIFVLKGLAKEPKGVLRIRVNFLLDVNGLLSVSASDEKSGKEQTVKVITAVTAKKGTLTRELKRKQLNLIYKEKRKSIF